MISMHQYNNGLPDLDEFGHNKEYYEKLFPIGSEFIYKSKYGSKSTLVSEGVYSSYNGTYKKFYIITILKKSNYKISYDVNDCISLIRIEKFKRLLKND